MDVDNRGLTEEDGCDRRVWYCIFAVAIKSCAVRILFVVAVVVWFGMMGHAGTEYKIQLLYHIHNE